MGEKLFNPASYNNKAPQPGMAAVDTNNSEEQQEDKKPAALEEKPARYDEASSREKRIENNTGD